MSRLVANRRQLVRSIDDPVVRLDAVIRDGFPSGHDDAEVVSLYTGIQAIRDDPDLADLVRSVTEEQVTLYREILMEGSAAGAFHLAGDPDDIARNLVALEDAYGLYAVGAGFPVEAGLRLTRAFAEMAIGRAIQADSIGPTGSCRSPPRRVDRDALHRCVGPLRPSD